MPGPEEVRIVVVDDSEDANDLMTDLLRSSGFAAKEATDATTALGLIQHWLPHCVLLDIDMPGIDGVDLARHIRANYARSIKLIAISGWPVSHPRAQAIRKIVDDYLRKPCDFEQLRPLLVGL